MDKEYHGLADAGTLGATQQPDALNVISATWVFTWTSNDHGDGIRAKSRRVVRGCQQREGIDYFRSFAPTLAASWFRFLGAIACELGVDLCPFDAEQAFVQSRVLKGMVYWTTLGLRRNVWKYRNVEPKSVRLGASVAIAGQSSGHSHKEFGFEQSSADACVMHSNRSSYG